MNTLKKMIIPTLIAGSLGMASATVLAEQPMHDKEHMKNQNHYQYEKSKGSDMSKTFEDGWKEGKIETAFLFNTNLNNFTIDADVKGDKVTLKGHVESDVDKDLAEEIALSIDGVDDVNNQLVVQKDAKKVADQSASDTFMSSVKDASITAAVKTKLLANSNVSGLDIDIDTENRVVTLKGEVESEAKKDLAEKIAANVDDVKKVKNNLKVVHS